METLLQVKVSPGASRNEIKARHGNVLRIRVKAPPEKGKANKELRRYLAKTLGISPRQVTVRSGEVSRNKIMAIEGLSESDCDSLLSEKVNLP